MRTSLNRRGFTLVELLIVIGIIAVLTAILLPAMQRARLAAQTAACLSNTRQIAMAVFQYAQVNRGILPYHVNTTITAPFFYSIYQDFNALYDGKQITGGKMQTLTSVDPLTVSSRVVPILVCPGEFLDVMTKSNDWRVGAEFKTAKSRNGIVGQFHCHYPYEWKYTSSGIATHYMFSGVHPAYADPNYPLAVSSTDYYGTPVPQMKLARVPAKCWLLMDGTAGDFGGMCPAFRHPNMSANFCYADGHAETLRSSDVDTSLFFGVYQSVYPADARSYINR